MAYILAHFFIHVKSFLHVSLTFYFKVPFQVRG